MNRIIKWGVLEIQRRPKLLRRGLALATKLLPRKFAGKVVSNAAMVRETFARPEDFWMGYLNAPKLKLGRFLLGMDPPDSAYLVEKPLLVETLNDLPQHIAHFACLEADRVAKQLARTWAPADKLDLASGFAEPVFVRALAHVFGVPSHGAPCPAFKLPANLSHEPLAHYIRTFGATIGSDHPAPFGLEEIALHAAPYLQRHLEDAIRSHRAGSIGARLPLAVGVALAPEQTVLGQLIARTPFSDGDAGIIRNITGMMAASASFPKAFASVLHELLARPEQLRGFAAAVLAQDEARALGYVREALRFRPPFPLLVRTCPNATSLRASSSDFASGEQLAFFPAAAMFDASVVSLPNVFNPQRPESNYFLFGGAPRECIGKALMLKLFLPMFAALFRQLPCVLDAQPGRFVYDGPVLDRYLLEVSGPVGALREPHVQAEHEIPVAPSISLGHAASSLIPPPMASCPMHAHRYADPPARAPSKVPEPAV